MLQTSHFGDSFGGEASQHHGSGCTEVGAGDGRRAQLSHAFNDGCAALEPNRCPHALQLGHMLQPVFIDLLADHAGALRGAHQGHERCLKIGWKPGKRLGGDVHGRDLAGGDRHGSPLDLDGAAAIAKLLDHSAEMLGNHGLHHQW